ncbi:MAG: hypothetical protein U0271_39455 [Polyangiaceae bacterium]
MTRKDDMAGSSTLALRRITRSLETAALAAGASLLSCGPPAPTINHVKTQPVTDPGPAFDSPAKWVSFPQSVGLPTATLQLDDGTCLAATDDGQRWIITPRDKSAPPCSGIGMASGSPAPEAIVGIQRTGNEYRFITDAGSVYTSTEPAGPFSRYAKPPATLRRASAHGSSIVGVGWDRNTYFYDGTWKAATLPTQAYAVDVTVDAKGNALWLGAPEQLLVSHDGGRTYAALPNQPGSIGSYEVGFTTNDELAVRGVAGTLVWNPADDTVSPTTANYVTNSPSVQVEIEPLVGPRTTSIYEQRAALDGKRYFEIEERSEEYRYYLNRGPLGGMLERLPLSTFDSCGNIRMAASGGVLGVACIHEAEGKSNLAADLYLSKNSGDQFSLVATVDTPSFSDLTLSVAQDGSFLLLGACKPAAPKKEEAKPADGTEPVATDPYADICYPKTPIFVRGSTVTAGSVANLEEGSARSPLLSPEGRVAYILGRNRKDSRPAIFVSRDGGATYQMRTIEAPQSSNWDSDDMGVDSEPNYVRPLYIHDGAQLSIDETGTLGIAGDREMGYVWVTFDADGRVASVAEPPDPASMIGGSGNRAVALGYGGMDGTMRLWETTDGGATWAEVAMTQAMVRYGGTNGVIPCGVAGCLFGDELARIGWEGQTETSLTALEDPAMPEPESEPGSPISCQLTPKTEWTRVDGRTEEKMSQSPWSSYAMGPSFPRLREIMRGKTIFSVVAIDDETNRVDLVSATLAEKEGAGPTLTTKPFLAAIKAKQGSWVALTARAQMEGHVALRAKVPTTSYGGIDTSKSTDGLELVWVNEVTGVSGKKTIDLDGTWSGGTVQGLQLRTALLTIAGNGVIARAYSGGKSLYADEKTTTTVDFPNLQRLLVDGGFGLQSDAAWIGGVPYEIGFLDRNPSAQIFASARGSTSGGKAKPGDPPPMPTPASAFAMTIGPANTELEWIYQGDQSGIAAFVGGADAGEAPRAYGFLLDKDGHLGAAVELPTLADLPDKPRGCSADVRKSTMRTVAPHFQKNGSRRYTGGRHVVMVTDPGAGASGSLIAPVGSLDSMWFAMDGAVLQGSRKEPCVAAWRGSSIRSGSVVVIAGDMSQAFVLRTVAGQRKPGGQWVQGLEMRPMTCKFQPDLPVPYEVQSRLQNRMVDDLP